MITRIRDVRRAKGLTLDDVARRCVPPTTAQTIGRLETGTRTVSVKWLNRIAAALDAQASDLVELPESGAIPVVAQVGPAGATAPTRSLAFTSPAVPAGAVGIRITAAVGDYRAGDELWSTRLPPERFSEALNRDVLVPRPAGRFVFGRLIGHEGDKLHLLPLDIGARQQIITNAVWIAVPQALIRSL